MKYRVVGWATYDDLSLEDGEITEEVCQAVIDNIKENGYLFTGWNHQESLDCAPVLNDGKIRRFSQRTFGGLMARAHGYYGDMDYAKFMFGMNYEDCVFPRDYFAFDEFVPEIGETRDYFYETDEKTFLEAKKNLAIKIPNEEAFRYIHPLDAFILTCGEKREVYMVKTVKREKDISKEELDVLEDRMYDYDHYDDVEKALAEYERLSIAIFLTLE